MSQNIFLSSEAVRPSTRWMDAFPDGICRRWNDLPGKTLSGDLLWLDTAHPGWAEQLSALVRILPDCPVVVLSMNPGGTEAVAAFEGGARGYCHALAVSSLFRDVEVVVRHGGMWIGPELMARVVGAMGRTLLPAVAHAPAALSARELQVAREVVAGLSNKEVAARLGITERTVKAHLGAIFEKLGIHDRLHLVLRLAEHNPSSQPVHQ